MLPIPLIIWYEMTAADRHVRRNEPTETMDDADQVRSYVEAYAWGGPTSALQLHHIRELGHMIRPGDTVLDLACGPGPLLLELAPVFPEARFIGADLSTQMLRYLEREAQARNLHNIAILQEDIRTLPSLANASIDLVISTSALHHLPDDDSLRRVFRRVRSLLTGNGGFYFFDFGLLKSSRARSLFVAELAKLAPPLTVRDYDLSLQAAFPIGTVFGIAKDELPRPFRASKSAFIDFLFMLQSEYRILPSAPVLARVDEIWGSLSFSMKLEHQMLRWLSTRTAIA